MVPGARGGQAACTPLVPSQEGPVRPGEKQTCSQAHVTATRDVGKACLSHHASRSLLLDRTCLLWPRTGPCRGRGGVELGRHQWPFLRFTGSASRWPPNAQTPPSSAGPSASFTVHTRTHRRLRATPSLTAAQTRRLLHSTRPPSQLASKYEHFYQPTPKDIYFL